MEKNIVDILMDEANIESIKLFDQDGRAITFKQVAFIPYRQKLYFILLPLDYIEGVGDNEAIVFYADEVDNSLCVETNEAIAAAVFEEYYALLDD